MAALMNINASMRFNAPLAARKPPGLRAKVNSDERKGLRGDLFSASIWRI